MVLSFPPTLIRRLNVSVASSAVPDFADKAANVVEPFTLLSSLSLPPVRRPAFASFLTARDWEPFTAVSLAMTLAILLSEIVVFFLTKEPSRERLPN